MSINPVAELREWNCIAPEKATLGGGEDIGEGGVGGGGGGGGGERIVSDAKPKAYCKLELEQSSNMPPGDCT